MDLGKVVRTYDYDFHKHRMLDRWWRKDCPEYSVCQSLRCYSPEDMKILLSDTGLNMEGIYNQFIWIEDELVDHQTMQYVVKLVNSK